MLYLDLMEDSKKNILGVVSSIGSLIFLVGTLISGLNLLYAVIERFIPDPVVGYFVRGGVDIGLSISISAFIVFLPLLIYASKKMSKDINRADVGSRMSATQSVAIALIVGIAILTLAIASITFIFYFLTGGLTIQFTAKLIATVIVGGLVFAYYRSLWRKAFNGVILGRKIFGMVIGSLSILLVCVGIYIINPLTIQDRKMDFGSLSSLMSARDEIENRWHKDQKLPKALQNIQRYEVAYMIKSVNVYELCADFKAVIKNQESKRNPYRDFIYDEIGRNCFTFNAGATKKYSDRDYRL